MIWTIGHPNISRGGDTRGVSSIVLPKKKPSENRVTHGVTHGAFESADFV